MYDQLGGGFHRYSVDEHWLVPHFEKMLYDNALLTWVYLEAYQATEKPLYSRVARQVLDYVLREMTQPEGGFYATQDADSEGEEGKFFVWLPEEVEEILGEEDARLFARYYGVTPEGNFEHGQSILHVQEESAVLASLLKVDEEAFAGVLEEGRRRLLEVRQRRVAPGRDDKILVAWNGMMISAMARAYQVLGEEAYLTAATSAADFGSQCIVVAIDARRVRPGEPPIPAEPLAMPNLALGEGSIWEVFVNGGRTRTGIDALKWAARTVGLGAGEVLLTSMDADGQQTGYDLELTKAVAQAVPVPVIASGGVGNPEHIYEGVTEGEADAALVASIFHYGTHSIREVKAYLAERHLPVRPALPGS